MEKKIAVPKVGRVVKKFKGTVISKSGINTIKVRDEIRKSHPLYGKVMKSHKNYLTSHQSLNHQNQKIKHTQKLIH